MSSIRVHLSDSERVCAVDGEAFAAWNQSLIEQILFAAAKDVSDATDHARASASVTFHITVDPDDGSLVIET